MKNKYLVLTKRDIRIQHGGVLVSTENRRIRTPGVLPTYPSGKSCFTFLKILFLLPLFEPPGVSMPLSGPPESYEPYNISFRKMRTHWVQDNNSVILQYFSS